MNAITSMMIICFKLDSVAGYLGLNLNKSLSKFDLSHKTEETSKVQKIFKVSVCLFI